MDNAPKSGWVPILGEFEVGSDQIRFLGRKVLVTPSDAPPGSEPVGQALVGLLLSSQTIVDGEVSATIEFDGITPETICELGVSYAPNPSHVVQAGLGGEVNAMFTIREFGGPRTKGQGWWYYHVGGDRASLRAQHVYHLTATFRGDTMSLRIDGVLVGSAEVTSPRGLPRQVVIFCKGDQPIRITNFLVSSVKPKAFVVMQFGTQYDDVYHDVVKGVCDSYEVSPLRADDVMGPGLIIGDIIREIEEAQLVIADVTPSNPNVFFEVGYALALRKPTILLARKGTALPFDIAGFRVLFYEDSIGGKNRLIDGLQRHLAAILGR